MMQLMLLVHQRRYDLPSWRMFASSPAVFNEEIGEMSFAQLSRCVLGDTVKAKFSHMHRQYKTHQSIRSDYGHTTN